MSVVDIDRRAPVKAEDVIEIRAHPGAVWDTVAAIERWPDWNPGVIRARLKGDLKPGTVFVWKTRSGTITSTLQVVERPARLAWTGRIMGIRAIHVWRFTAVPGGTRVETAESMTGPMAGLLRGMFTAMVTRLLRGGLEALKAETERAAGRGTAAET